MTLRAVSKAIAGFIAASVSALGTAMSDGDVTRPEVIASIGAGLVGFAVVYSAPRNVER